MDVIQE